MKNEKTIRIIILLIIAIVVVCAFRFGYMPLNEKTEAVEAENVQLQSQLTELNLKILHQAEYEDATTASMTVVNDTINRYAAGNTPEKSIMIISGMESRIGAKVSAISFGQETQFFSSTNVPSVLNLGVYGFKSTLGINFQASYKSLKDMLSFIAEYPERMNVSTLSATFSSETGYLTGSANINLYSIAGTDKEYVSPVIGGVNIGTENIFGTIE